MASERQVHPYTFDRVVRMVLTAIGAVALFALAKFLAGVLIPFVAAAVLAYVLNPLVTAVGTRIQRRWLAVTTTFAGLGIVALALVVAGGWLAFMQFERFSTTASNLLQAYQDVLSELPGSDQVPVEDRAPGESGASSSAPRAPEEKTPDVGERSVGGPASAPSLPDDHPRSVLRRELNTLREAFRELLSAGSAPTAEHQGASPADRESMQRDRFERFWQRVSGTELFRAVRGLVPPDFDVSRWALNLGSRLFQSGWLAFTSGLHATIVFVMFCILVLVYLFFLLLEYPQYVAMGRGFLPPQYRADILELLSEFDLVLRRYLRGQFVVAMCTGVILAIGFSCIGLPLAIPLGLFIGLLNMVPYLQLVMLPVVLLLALLRPFEAPGTTVVGSLLWVGGVLLTAQVIQDTLLTPRIMGKVTGLKPVFILLGVFVWGKLLGMLGLLLAIPLTSLGIAYYRRWVLKHERRQPRQ